MNHQRVGVWLVEGGIAEKLERCSPKLDSDFCMPFRQTLTGTQVKRNASPAPIIDIQSQADKGFGPRFGGDSKLRSIGGNSFAIQNPLAVLAPHAAQQNFLGV